MKVLFIFPEVPNTYLNYEFLLKFFRKKAVSPPVGLLTVAATLPAEWPKRLVDMRFAELKEEDLLWADYAFISAMSCQIQTARDVIDRCRKAKLKVVAGGPLFTSQYQKFEGVDHFILNEAEITLPLFLEDLKQNAAKHVYKTSELADMNTTPIPLWELADMKQYFSLGLLTSRGCRYSCDFCEVHALFGGKRRFKSESRVISELDAIYDRGWRGDVHIWDDNFVADKKWLKSKLLPALIKWNKKKGLQFHTNASIDMTEDEELMRMMVEAGFDFIYIGIETPNNDSLDECNKNHNKNRDFIRDAHKVHQMGMRVVGGFVIGFDSDTPSIFQKQIDLIQEAGITMPILAMLQALPGTKLQKRLKAEKRLIEGREFLLGSTEGIEDLNFIPSMGAEELSKGYEKMIKHLHSPANYYPRLKTFLLQYKTLKKVKTKVNLNPSDLAGLIRSIFHLGFIDKDRFQYWKFVSWTAIKRPGLLLDAMILALVSYHFKKYFKC